MWRANGNPNHCTNLDEILHKQGSFWCRFAPCPLPPGPGGLETLKADGHIFKMLCRLQINPGRAGYLS